jgi:hypothetical protein
VSGEQPGRRLFERRLFRYRMGGRIVHHALLLQAGAEGSLRRVNESEGHPASQEQRLVTAHGTKLAVRAAEDVAAGVRVVDPHQRGHIVVKASLEVAGARVLVIALAP